MVSFGDNELKELACVGNEKYIILCNKDNSSKCGIVSEKEDVSYVSFINSSTNDLTFDKEIICLSVVDDIEQDKRRVNFSSNWIELYSNFTSEKFKSGNKSACYVSLDINRTSGKLKYQITNFMHGMSWEGEATCSLKKNKF
jgi:hypothetical protein